MSRSDGPAPVVSVVMPAYNAGRTLAEAVDSVLAQTFQNWELILLDDGSRDGTASIARSYTRADPRIRYEANPGNLGAAASRNRGVSLARGSWIAFLDSDDVWRPEKLARQLKLAEQTGAQLLYTSYSLWKEEKNERRAYLVPPSTDYASMLAENVIGCSTVMAPRAILAAHPFSLSTYHEDYALWLELLRSGCRASGCTEILVDWRVVPGSRSFSKWNAAWQRWHVYRRAENLPLGKSLAAFGAYGVRGIKKHKRV